MNIMRWATSYFWQSAVGNTDQPLAGYGRRTSYVVRTLVQCHDLSTTSACWHRPATARGSPWSSATVISGDHGYIMVIYLSYLNSGPEFRSHRGRLPGSAACLAAVR